ncbi:MAG: SPFH domain-containing protein [Sandaracinus sp.]
MQGYGYPPYQPPPPDPVPFDPMFLWLIVGALILAGVLALLFIQFMRNFLYIARPNEALVFSGKKSRTEEGGELGYTIVKSGHRGIRLPFLHTVNRLDMTTQSIDILVQNAYSRGNIALEIHAIANVKIHSDERWLRNAVERFLNRARSEIEIVAKQTLEGAVREVVAQLTPEEVNQDRLKFAEKLIHAAEDDLQKLGLQLDVLKIQHVSDATGYLNSIGRPVIAAALRDAENAENQAGQETQQAQADASRRAEVTRANAQTAIQKKQNELRQIKAQLEGDAQAVEREAEAAAKTARAQAEKELQGYRAVLEQKRLMAEVVIPSQIQQQAQSILAKGQAAPTIENGAAQVEVLRALSEAWASMGAEAREIYVIQHLEQIVGAVVTNVEGIDVGEVNVLDQGDGQALASYAASYPKIVASVMKSLKDSTGVDVPSILAGNASKGGA